MRYVLALFLVLSALAGYTRAEEWKEIQRLESADEITWVDMSSSGDRVAYVCKQHDGYLYNLKKKKTFNLSPPRDPHSSSYSGYVTNAVFLGDVLITHGGFGKYSWSGDGKPTKVAFHQILGEVGVPRFLFAKAQKAELGLFYFPEWRDGDMHKPSPTDLIRRFVYIVHRSGMKSQLIHTADVETVACSSAGEYVFVAGGGQVGRWAMKESGSSNAHNHRPKFNLPSGRVADMATSLAGDVVVVAMKNGQVVFSANMQNSTELPVDSMVVTEKSSKITNHGLAMPGDGQIAFVARDRLTNKSETIHEVVLVGPDHPYKQVLVGKSPVIKIQLVDEDTLVCLDAGGSLGFFSIKSDAVQSDVKWYQTGLPDATDLRVSANTVVVKGSKVMVIYHRNGKEGLAAK